MTANGSPHSRQIANRRLGPTTYRRKPVEVEAMRVTEAAEQADAIRAWLGPYGSEPNSSLMRPGCVVVRVGPRQHDLAPPGCYVVSGDGRVWVMDADEFAATYERVRHLICNNADQHIPLCDCGNKGAS